MSRIPVFELRSAEICKPLISPVRVEVSEFLRSNGEATVSELAAMLCRPPELLYRHLEILVKAGMVEQTGYRKKGRHVERVYDLTSDDIFLAFKGRGSPEDNAAIVDMIGSFSRVMDRTIRRATASRLIDYEARPRQLMFRYEMSWLTTEDLEELHELIARIKAIMDAGRKKRHGSVYRWLAVLCPFSEKSGADKGNREKTEKTEKAEAAEKAEQAGSKRSRHTKRDQEKKSAANPSPSARLRSLRSSGHGKTQKRDEGAIATPSSLNGTKTIAKNSPKKRKDS